jgi:SAM-dependent methyltransferase
MNEPANPSSQEILPTVARYYADRLERFGASPRGVDWNSAESQDLRFSRLLELVTNEEAGSIIDIGCGYGALLDYLHARGLGLNYRGFDISEAMIKAARERHAETSRCSFTADPSAREPATYAVASGIFNVKLNIPIDRWREYVLETLTTLQALSRCGFAFNMLSTYSDSELRRDDLFYADPREIFDVCKRQFSPRVVLLHDYPLYEFTIIVKN